MVSLMNANTSSLPMVPHNLKDPNRIDGSKNGKENMIFERYA